MSYLIDTLECHNGYYDDPQHDGCIPCPIGTYDDPINHDACMPCPEGQTTTEEGSINMSECHSGEVWLLILWIDLSLSFIFKSKFKNETLIFY